MSSSGRHYRFLSMNRTCPTHQQCFLTVNSVNSNEVFGITWILCTIDLGNYDNQILNKRQNISLKITENRSIWTQMEFRLVPYQSESGNFNQIFVKVNMNWNEFLCVRVSLNIPSIWNSFSGPTDGHFRSFSSLTDIWNRAKFCRSSQDNKTCKNRYSQSWYSSKYCQRMSYSNIYYFFFLMRCSMYMECTQKKKF